VTGAMTELRFMAGRPPGVEDLAVPGRLIVIESTDGVGRSTQIRLLKEWLEDQGYGVLDTGLRRSDLAGPGIARAKEGHTLDPITLNLFYATDFWDRFERRVLPALRAGMVVIADRYVYSLIARASVRGIELGWLENLYAFAPIPDLIVYMDIDVRNLLNRTLQSTGFDYWESGQDFLRGGDLFGNFVQYQEMLLAEFRRLADRYGFRVVDARRSIAETFRSLRDVVNEVVQTMDTGDGVVPFSLGSASDGAQELGAREPAERG
jgi:dTMP kinase